MQPRTKKRIVSAAIASWQNAILLPVLLLAAGCMRPGAGEKAGPFAAPSDLIATMPDPFNIHLRWKNHAPAAAGNLVEFQLWPEGASPPADEREEFLILGFLDAGENTFRHEDLGSETVFTYRIRPYFGKCTEPVGITTGEAAAAKNQPDEPEGPLEEPEKNAKRASDLKSVRATGTFAAAVPTDLTVALSGVTHLVLRWQDHAADADGYLVEISRYPDRDFQVCALLPPHTTSFRKTSLPPETRIYFRVRAFFYGPPSNRVTKTTGPDPMRTEQPKASLGK